MRRLLAALFLTVITAAFTPARAQQRPQQPPTGQPGTMALPCGEDCGGGDVTPPNIELTPVGTVTVSSPLFTVGWCDDTSLNEATHWIKVNGQYQTGAFTYEPGVYGGCDPIAAIGRSQASSIVLNPGANSVEAYICDGTGNCTYRSWSIYYENKPTPILSLAPHRGDLVDYGRCAMVCFAATYSQSVVPAFTLNTPRSVTLAFNGETVRPRPFIHVDVTHPGNQGNLPSYFYLKLIKPGGAFAYFLNGEQELRFSPLAGGAMRLSGQFDAIAEGLGATRAHSVTVVVGAHYADGTRRETSATTRILVVNESGSGIARGWTVAGLARIAYVESDGSVLITEGDGSAAYFQKSGSQFLSPAGDLTRVILGGPTSGAAWTRYLPDTSRVSFNSQGLPFEVRDRHGNTTLIEWTTANGALVPWKIQVPTLQSHNQFTLVYDANGLDYIQDFWIRQTQVTVSSDGNRNLSAITDPDGVPTTFAYDSVGLKTVTGRLGDTTRLNYQVLGAKSTGRLAAITLPAVPVYGGGTVSPVDSLWPWQTLTTPYSSTASPSYFATIRSDSVRATMKDAGGHAASLTVNALGQPLRSTGPIGDTITVIYNSSAQPTQVVDRLGVTSSFSYDAVGFMTYSSAGGVVAYQRRGALGQADSVWGHTTARRLFVNGANGQVDSMRVGGQSGVPETKVRYTYNSVGQLLTARDPSGHLIEWHDYGLSGMLYRDSLPTGIKVTYLHDQLGRLTAIMRPGQPTQAFEYDLVNRVIRSWDSVNTNPTRYGYGAQLLNGIVTDTVTDPAGNVYLFRRNALGWVVSQTDPAGATETMEYDRDGLLRRHVNRRSQIDSVTYDALHRPTMRGGSSAPAWFSYSGDGRMVTDSNAFARVTAFRHATRPQVDSVRTLLAGVSQA